MGGGLRLPPLTTSVETEQVLENIKSSLSRDLPRAGRFKPHKELLSIFAGGPSAKRTYEEISGNIGAVNASLQFLLERDIKPWACGVLDPNEHMADLVTPCDGVFYFVASSCHPSVFDKLKNNQVILWHASGTPGMDEIVGDELQIGGGSTMGLRWFNLGYVMGFRRFEAHGLDSSFEGKNTHAYPDRRDGGQFMQVGGYQTSLSFLNQVQDFFDLIERYKKPDIDPVEIEVKGDGLLPDQWREKLLENGWESVKYNTKEQDAA